MVGKSVEHPKCPIGTGMWDYIRMKCIIMGMLIEPAEDGKGTKVTEIRNYDIGGSLIASILDKVSKKMPTDSFYAWSEAVDRSVRELK